MNNPLVNHFLIDAGNVYLLADHNIAARKLKNLYGLSLSLDDINKILHGDDEAKFALGKMFGFEYARRVEKQLGLEDRFLSENDLKSMHDEHIYGIDQTFMGILHRIERHFGAKNIAVVTQTHEWQTEREHMLLRTYGYSRMEVRFPERVFRSNELRLSKKSRSFWAHVFKATGFDPAKTLLVDDSQASIDAALGYNHKIVVFKYSPNNVVPFLNYLSAQKII